jgi:hypothetical protein
LDGRAQEALGKVFEKTEGGQAALSVETQKLDQL